MSLVFDSREIAVGPTVGCHGAGAPLPAYVSKGKRGCSDREGVTALEGISGISDLLQSGRGSEERRSAFCLDCKESASSESLSIGVGGASSGSSEAEDEGEDEVQSKFKGGLGSMGSLEESLPIKRGLSNFFSGKSKSFANLSDATTVRDLAKQENPFNKRRRILMAYKTRLPKAAFYSPLNTSLPNIVLEEGAEEEEKEEENSIPTQERKFKCLDKSPRSFSFTDLNSPDHKIMK